MQIGMGSILVIAALLAGLVAWIHRDRLEQKDDLIKAKDETIRMKSAEIESLRLQIQSPSDLMTKVQVIKASSEVEISDLRKQLSEVSGSELARRAELEEKLKLEQAHRVKIGELEAKLSEQVAIRTKLEQEVIALRAQTKSLVQGGPVGRRLLLEGLSKQPHLPPSALDTMGTLFGYGRKETTPFQELMKMVGPSSDIK
jgi:hypothetical protein